MQTPTYNIWLEDINRMRAEFIGTNFQVVYKSICANYTLQETGGIWSMDTFGILK